METMTTQLGLGSKLRSGNCEHLFWRKTFENNTSNTIQCAMANFGLRFCPKTNVSANRNFRPIDQTTPAVTVSVGEHLHHVTEGCITGKPLPHLLWPRRSLDETKNFWSIGIGSVVKKYRPSTDTAPNTRYRFRYRYIGQH